MHAEVSALPGLTWIGAASVRDYERGLYEKGVESKTAVVNPEWPKEDEDLRDDMDGPQNIEENVRVIIMRYCTRRLGVYMYSSFSR